MRVLLVTLADQLPSVFNEVLNPALEYCAIVTDEPDLARIILENVKPLQNVVYPFYELKECIENFYYDAVLFVSDHRTTWNGLLKQFQNYGVPNDKFVNFCISNIASENHFLVERNLRYYQEHSSEFDIFITGVCYATLGIDTTQFNHRVFNLGRGNQDLYYDYQVAKYILSKSIRGGGNKNIKYALICLAPYSFHYDLSKSYDVRSLVQYCVALNDLHNFWMPIEKYKSLFRESFLNFRLSFEHIDLNNLYFQKANVPNYMNFDSRINARERIDIWTNKSYPETVKENVKILDDYLTLCEESAVRPIMFLPPFTEGYMKHFSREKIDEFYYLVREAQKKHSMAIFVDGWKTKNFSDKDFNDVDHMNINYATKFSKMLNDLIMEIERKN